MSAEITDKIAQVAGNYYDEILLNTLLEGTTYYKWKNERVTKYLTISIPIIKKHICTDEDGEIYETGFLITFKQIKLLKIGSQIIKTPYIPKRKTTGKAISFKRYSDLDK